MNRWTNEFQKHSFHQIWSEIKAELAKIKLSDSSDVTQVQELARLTKVSDFVLSFVTAIDPDLLFFDALSSLTNNAQACLNKIKSYQESSNFNFIHEANTQIDEVLKNLKNLSFSNPLSNSSAYSDALDSQAKIISSIYKTLETDIAQDVKSIRQENSNLNTTKKNAAAINNYYSLLFEDKIDKTSIKTELDSYFEKLKSYHTDLFEGRDGHESIERKVGNQIDAFNKKLDVITKDYTNASNILKELTETHLKIFGGTATDGQTYTSLEDQITAKIELLENIKKEYTGKYDVILEEINGLINDATNAGLAGSFAKERERLKTEKYVYTALFVVSIIMIGLMGTDIYSELSTIIRTFFGFGIENTETTSLNLLQNSDLISKILRKTAWLLPSIWLALFSASRRSESNRLEQEYAHKETVAKSYESFKRQAEILEKDAGELQKKLLDAAIVTFAYNPAQSLDKKHDEQPPTGKLTESAINLIEIIISKFKK